MGVLATSPLCDHGPGTVPLWAADASVQWNRIAPIISPGGVGRSGSGRRLSHLLPLCENEDPLLVTLVPLMPSTEPAPR